MLTKDQVQLLVATITGTGSVLIQSLDKEVQERVLHAIIQSMSKVYYLALGGAVLGFMVALGMKWEKISMSMPA